jgi:hypothetical protein
MVRFFNTDTHLKMKSLIVNTLITIVLSLSLITACQYIPVPTIQVDRNSEVASATSFQTVTPIKGETTTPTSTSMTGTPDPPSSTSTSEIASRDPANWKDWPIIPQTVSIAMVEVYQRGLKLGNDDHAFSILGDCHSLPDVFMGVYERDLEVVAELDSDLQETVDHFQGSFDRYSPTIRGGTTEGALLWWRWNLNEEGYCEEGETPIDCELRYHQPIITYVHVGTHWEARSMEYFGTIIEQLLEQGSVPIIVFKADNRELDERVNENLAKLAVEYELPVWNFWASLQDLPNQGLPEDTQMELTDAAYAVHRRDGLVVLDAVYRALREN